MIKQEQKFANLLKLLISTKYINIIISIHGTLNFQTFLSVFLYAPLSVCLSYLFRFILQVLSTPNILHICIALYSKYLWVEHELLHCAVYHSKRWNTEI